MNENRREIMENVYLTYLPATKFKTGCLSAQLVTPLRRETAAWNALLPPVLSRGTVRYPDMESLSAAMDRLYGMNLSTTIRKRRRAPVRRLRHDGHRRPLRPRRRARCWNPRRSCSASCFSIP